MRTRWKIAQKAELNWWKKYLKNRPTPEYLAWKKDYWEDFMSRINIHPDANDICLDAGCGPAGINLALEHVQSVKAIDPLWNSYAEQLSVAQKVSANGHQFQQLLLEDLNETEVYNYVFCLNVINHVSDWEKATQNLWNALKPGGTLILSSDVHRFPWLRFPFRLMQWDILHPQQHSLDDYIHLFQRTMPDYKMKIQLKHSSKGVFDYYIFVLEKPQTIS